MEKDLVALGKEVGALSVGVSSDSHTKPKTFWAWLTRKPAATVRSYTFSLHFADGKIPDAAIFSRRVDTFCVKYGARVEWALLPALYTHPLRAARAKSRK